MESRQPTIELIPGEPGATHFNAGPLPPSRKRYWQQFIYTFAICAIVGLLLTWLRAPVYQSTAILRAFYDTPNAEQDSSLIHEQLIVHQQRLISRSLIDELTVELNKSQSLRMSADDLSQQLKAIAIPNSRLINLVGEDSNPERLYALLNLWTSLYLKQFKTDLDSSSTQEKELLNLQLNSLKPQIQQKRKELEIFRQSNEIISLERDESRVLNKIQALGTALDTATEEAAQARATLNAIKQAKRQGKTVIRPQDQPGLDSMESRAIELLESLREFEQKYTPEYMALDPAIVAVQRKLDLLKERITKRKIESQKAYLEEAEHTLATAREKNRGLKKQYDEFQQTAQAFSTQFEQYAQLNKEVEELETEAQAIRAELTKNEVRQPHQTRLELLEPPFLPEKPIRPYYWRDTFIVLLFSLLLGACSWGFLYLSRPKLKPAYAHSITIDNQLLAAQQQAKTIPVSTPLQIAESLPKELSHQEVSCLMEVASDETKLLIFLLLSGVQPEEALHIARQDITTDKEKSALQIKGASHRTVTTPANLNKLISGAEEVQSENMEKAIFENMLAIESLINCASHDANITHAESITPETLWHTYIADLVRRGLRLNELHKVGGNIPPEKLSQYRGLSPSGDKQALEQINPIYSLFIK